MITQTTTDTTGTFSLDEWRTLYMLRDRYQQGRDLFSAHELMRLHFMRWLYQRGCLTDHDGYDAAVLDQHAA
jgi:hypothetical protein